MVTLTAATQATAIKSGSAVDQPLRNAVSTMRVWDSLTIPQLGRGPRAGDQSLLAGRTVERNAPATGSRLPRRRKDPLDFPTLRRLNRSTVIEDGAVCTWNSLLSDLGRIIADVNPTIVVAPHPQLDPHPDHLFATLAVAQALASARLTVGRLFFYTVHNSRSELWPFGPAGSGVALLPILPEDGVCASGFYSHELSIERQRLKCVALEAMHDVRDFQWPPDAFRQVGSRVAAELRGLVHGMGVMPTSYLRRAVRPDELSS